MNSSVCLYGFSAIWVSKWRILFHPKMKWLHCLQRVRLEPSKASKEAYLVEDGHSGAVCFVDPRLSMLQNLRPSVKRRLWQRFPMLQLFKSLTKTPTRRAHQTETGRRIVTFKVYISFTREKEACRN